MADRERREGRRPLILHVDTERGRRGGQAQLLHLLRSDPQRHVLATSRAATWLDEARATGAAVVPLPFWGRHRGTRALGELVQRVQPDLVAVHTAHALAHASRLSLRPVVHRRNDFVPSPLGVARLDAARGVVAVSAAVGDVLRQAGVRRAPIRVVYDGVDLDGVVCAPVRQVPGRPLVVAVGALVAHKGHVHLVDALARLPGVHVAILGGGPLRGRLLRRARWRGVRDRLHLLGPRSDVPAWLAAADVVCHPSVEEGLGSSVIEALAAGCAVVGTRAGGLPEVLEGRGHLVAPGDPEGLARALTSAIAHPERLRERARASAEDLAARFSVTAMVNGTMRAYAEFPPRSHVPPAVPWMSVARTVLRRLRRGGPRRP